jgi:hypothetical protein
MVAFRCSRVYTLLVATSRALWRTSQTSFPYNERVSLQAVVRNLLANHSEGSAFGSHLRPRLQLSQRNRTILDSSSCRTVPGSAVCSNTSPCWTDREVVPAARQNFLKVAVSLMGAGRTQNGLGMKSRLPIIWPRRHGQTGFGRGKGVYRSKSEQSGGLGCYRHLLVIPWRQGRICFLEARIGTVKVTSAVSRLPSDGESANATPLLRVGDDPSAFVYITAKRTAGRSDGTPPAAGWHAGIKTAKTVIANHLHGCIVRAARRPKWKSRVYCCRLGC